MKKDLKTKQQKNLNQTDNIENLTILVAQIQFGSSSSVVPPLLGGLEKLLLWVIIKLIMCTITKLINQKKLLF